MNRARLQIRRLWFLALLLGVGGAGSFRLSAAENNNESFPKSPVEVFRELLVMPAAKREEQLSIRPNGIRERVEAKLNEYLALRPEERELRLLATELHWYLTPLMKLGGTNRAEQLTGIPPNIRALVESRLDTWDIYPPSLKEEMLTNELAMQLFTQPPVPSGSNPESEDDINHWKLMPEDQRKAICNRFFKQFFELSPDEKTVALNTLSPAEQSQMQVTLESYAALTREQRDICIRYFDKFASMSTSERDQFLKKAEQWRLMSPQDRERWRELVNQVPSWPPLPADLVNSQTTKGN